jgi:hypothetical protein
MASARVMKSICIILVCFGGGKVKGEVRADFEDLDLGTATYWNGADGSGGFASGNAWFGNNYDQQYGSWDGFAYSNITDTTSSGWIAQYNAITGGGQGGSENYAVGYMYLEPPRMVLDEPTIVSGLYVTNNNWAYYLMLNGGGYFNNKKFGGPSGNDADWFLLTITGKDAAGVVTDAVECYLADYQFADNSKDYILNWWKYVDLTPLGVVKSVEFSLDSSDKTGAWLNTPAYFVIDTVVPEPGTLVLLGFGVMGVIRRRKK